MNTINFTLRLPAKLVAQLDAVAGANGKSRNALIDDILTGAINSEADTSNEPLASWPCRTSSQHRDRPCDMCGERLDRFTSDFVILLQNGKHLIVCQLCRGNAMTKADYLAAKTE